jgi:hypothetical protein
MKDIDQKSKKLCESLLLMRLGARFPSKRDSRESLIFVEVDK